MRYSLLLFLALHVAYDVDIKADDMSSLLYNGNCITCHKDTNEESAPSMYEVKSRYINAFPKRKDFVQYMSKWVSNPDKSTSLMNDAIKSMDLCHH